jgi:SAM-dependent methyltransferase
MSSFFLGLFLLSAGTLVYEVLLTRLLSVVSWYYLAFVSVSMAMFGMTAGALAVQLRPALFDGTQAPRRLVQASFAMAVAMPFTLLTLLAVPIEISYSAQTLYSFALFTTVIAVPFFFSGIGVCLALTRTPFPTGRVYAVDLVGAAAGCLLAVGLLETMDAPSAVLAVSGLLFLATAGFANHAGDPRRQKRCLAYALLLFMLAGANASTRYGIQPIWIKGKLDPRNTLLAEFWNPISKVRLWPPVTGVPFVWGPSRSMPRTPVEYILMDIDNDAATPLYRFSGDLKEMGFLHYDVTALAVLLRAGGSAAIIGMGGGRDVLAAATQGFRRIVGIEVNGTILDVDLRWYGWFSGLAALPGLEVQHDEGRSYLTRTDEKFDIIQASLVDTWAAASAGAMTLSENSLYTVDAWRIFYRHLKPGGLVTFSRWNAGAEAAQTFRMFSLAWATLLSEGATDPAKHLALIGSDRVATLLLSNRPFSAEDLANLHALVKGLGYDILYVPGDPTPFREISTITAAKTLQDLARLSDGPMDFSPTYDSSPFFFNSLRLRRLPALLRTLEVTGNLRALAFMLCFLLAALLLLAFAIVVPLIRGTRLSGRNTSALAGGIAYFVAIGLGFLFVEIAMMQELSVFLGQPIYSLVVVLAGLIFFSGMGSLASEKLRAPSRISSRLPAIAAAVILCGYAAVALPFIHAFAARLLWQRVLLCLALMAPSGFLMGFCFPVGLRWMKTLGQEENLPWMWALNGAASVTASFLAIIVAMETSLTTAVLIGAACYALGGTLLPWTSRPADAA